MCRLHRRRSRRNSRGFNEIRPRTELPGVVTFRRRDKVTRHDRMYAVKYHPTAENQRESDNNVASPGLT